MVVASGRVDPNNPELTLYAAVIAKYADTRTRDRTALSADVRESPEMTNTGRMFRCGEAPHLRYGRRRRHEYSQS